MRDFNSERFESLMDEAGQFHRLGQYDRALDLSIAAYALAPLDSFEKGRAARDTAARYDRLGDLDEAQRWADVAYAVHDALLRDMDEPTREAYRERAASSIYVGVNGLHRYIAAQRRHDMVSDSLKSLAALRHGWVDIHAATITAGDSATIDQYEINAARRVSVAESLLGSKRAGLRLSLRALQLSRWSESHELDTANPHLSTAQRNRAKVRAFAGGLAALGTNVLTYPQNRLTRAGALLLAEKAL